jgi:ribonuclease VapC
VIILDASALLAFLLREPGHEKIAPRLAGALMSSANLAEVLSKMAERGEDPDFFHQEIRALGISIEDLTEAHAADAARMRRETSSRGLSLGDRLCLALARDRNLPVLTTDRAWLGFDFGIPVEFGR